MKWLLTFNIVCAGMGLLSAAEPPMPMAGVLPHPGVAMTPMSTTPTVPQPTLMGTPSWNGSPAEGCQTCNSGGQAKTCGSAFARFCEWVSFRPCPPVHASCVPQPPRAPLRTYFRYSACGVGCADATDCGKAGCGRQGGSCGSDSVNIPMPSRMCGSARCGGSPVWGNSCGSGSTLSRLMGCFGLSGSGCGGKGGCGTGGCSSCQYSKVPMSDIGQYQNFEATQSVGRVGGLTSVGVAPAGSHYANPYRATSPELQYRTPDAILTPAQPMAPPMPPPGTNPFPGPQGTLPYSRPFTNP